MPLRDHAEASLPPELQATQRVQYRVYLENGEVVETETEKSRGPAMNTWWWGEWEEKVQRGKRVRA